MQFGSGRRWRCAGPRYVCEVDDAGNTPNYCNKSASVAKIRRIKSFYQGKLSFGILDEYGTAADILTANSLTESLGTVPSPLSTSQLRTVFTGQAGIDTGVKLDAVIRYIAANAKYLERREPGYVNPVASPGRVSVGAHHMLISTATSFPPYSTSKTPEQRGQAAIDLVCRMPAESLYAASFTIAYFNRFYQKHLNQPPLLAATYNAGSPRPSSKNIWNLVQYGEHIDRWVAYYNTSRMV